MKLNAFHKAKGWIEVICGPMFAGKSEELLRRLNRLKYADINYVIFKPVTDTRSQKLAKSRDGRKYEAIEINKTEEIFDFLKKQEEKKIKYDVIAIDEAQFLDDNLGEVCNELANKNYVVYVAGLDLDFRGVPFKSMTNLLAYADTVTKLTAICTICGGEANRTQRIINGQPAKFDDPTVQIGDSESYEARCRNHHEIKK